jgi:hypothetical protein
MSSAMPRSSSSSICRLRSSTCTTFIVRDLMPTVTQREAFTTPSDHAMPGPITTVGRTMR